MTYVLIPSDEDSGGSAVDTGTRDTYMTRGLAAAGISAEDAALWWDDFEKAVSSANVLGYLQTGTGTGAWQTQSLNTAGGGFIRGISGATANSHASLDASTPWISNVATARWYICARLKISAAVNNTAFVGAGLRNVAVSSTIVAGFAGALDAVNFGVQYDGNLTGSVASLATAVDASVHVFEIWGVGDAKLHARLDGGTEITPVTLAAAPGDAMYPFITVRNGGTAANRQIDIDWIGGVSARTS